MILRRKIHRQRDTCASRLGAPTRQRGSRTGTDCTPWECGQANHLRFLYAVRLVILGGLGWMSVWTRKVHHNSVVKHFSHSAAIIRPRHWLAILNVAKSLLFRGVPSPASFPFRQGAARCRKLAPISWHLENWKRSSVETTRDNHRGAPQRLPMKLLVLLTRLKKSAPCNAGNCLSCAKLIDASLSCASL